MNQQGVRRLAFYCDESSISGDHPHYGFGAIIMQYQRRGQFVAEFEELARGLQWGEVKWTKTASSRLAYHKRIVEHFFRSSYLYFHAIVVNRAWVDVRQFHDGSYDLARRKHFTNFIASKVKTIIKEQPKRKYDFRIYVDPIPSSYKKADEAVWKVGNNMVTSGLSEHPMVEGAIDVIENVYTVDSKDRPEIQVCDLLLGAVMSAWNQKGESEAKADLRRYIAEHLGWDELRKTTFAAEKKFNVWYLTDKFKTEAERTQRADVVRLKYPLPASRRTRR